MSSTPTSEGGGSEQKNAEIWSTRLQRELLAMTTDNASPEAKEEVAAILPSFCTIKDHALDIERGNCTVTCVIDLPPAAKKNKPVSPKTKGEEPKDDTTTKAEETANDDAKEKTEVTEKTEKEVAEESPVTAESMDPIVVTMDVSLQKKPDGSINTSAVSYPFMKPVAILTSGSARFPEGSTIRDGDIVDIELDWTPSLHLTDALLNVALKVKECISQGEPIHPGTVEKTKPDINLNAMVNQAKKLGTSFSQSLRGLADVASKGSSDSPDKSKTTRIGIGRKKKEKKPRPKATAGEVRIGDEIHMLEAPWVDCQGVYSCKSIRRPKFVEEAMAVAKQHMQADTESQVSRPSFEDIDQGEVPDDFGDFLRLQAGGISQVANAGLAGAGAMFRSFATSARGVLEESFLMITESHIIEMKSNKLNLSTGIVSFAIPIEMLAKLKFRRQESISLFFKPAPDDPLIYMCPDSADCVHQIQTVLKRHGVKGKHTNAATHRAINQALHLVQEIQTKELALKHDPSVERVNEIMDLYRQAAERFEVAGDARHSEVVTHMRKFLALPLTVGILDGSYKKPAGDAPIATTSGEGVVLSIPTEEDDKATGGSGSREDDKAFERTMEDILKEAEADLANIAVEEDPELDAMLEEEKGPFGGDADDAIADFENMLKEADDELAELMNM